MTGMKPRVTGEAVSVYSFSNWCLFIPDFVSLSVYRLHPLKGAALLRIDPDMVTALVDCFYGGTGARLPFNRKDFTPTEAIGGTACRERCVTEGQILVERD